VAFIKIIKAYSMLQDKIISYFQRNPKLKVLFFFDPDGTNLAEVKELNLDDFRVKYFQHDWFNAKLELNALQDNEKVFFYLPMPSPQSQTDFENFPLLGLLKANKELKMDDVAGFMEEYHLQPHQLGLVKRYMKELQFHKTQNVLKPFLNAAGFDERNVQQGLFCSFLDFGKMEDWDTIFVRLLSYTLPTKESELKRFLMKTTDFGLFDVLNKKIHQHFDCTLSSADASEIIDLVKRLKYNSIVQGLVTKEADPYKALKVNNAESLEAMNRLREMGFNHPTMGTSFAGAWALNGSSIQESKLIDLYGLDTEYIYQTDALKWEMIKRVLSQPTGNWLDAEKKLEQISVQTQDEGVLKNTLAFLRYSIGVLSKINMVSSFILDRPDDYLDRYTEEFYLIDYYYRKAVLFFRNLEMGDTPIEGDLEKLKQKVENQYARFTYTLNHEWLACLSNVGYDYKKIKAQKQYNFFQNYVSPLKQKVAVIISDALRYEVAHELVNELHKDEKNVSELSFQLASIPSETSFGMANLLPGKNYVYDGEISIDGEKTMSSNRDKILKKHSPTYQAVSFENILSGTKSSNRELFKADVVYIYHDAIDKEGHSGNERKTFNAAQEAIAELARMVKNIQGGFNVNKVIVTSDHGFIYNDCDIDEADKNQMGDCTMTEASARHYITNEDPDISIGHKISLFKTTKYQEAFQVIIPDSVNRFKKPGSRYQFTHGGGSLQELVVPVIVSSRKEDKIQRKVNMMLLSRSLSMVSNNLKIQLVQENPLSAKEKERMVVIAIFCNDEVVSNKVELLLNSTNELPSERIFTVSLSLNTKVIETLLRLKIYDKDDLLNPLIEEIVKNNTLIERDF